MTELENLIEAEIIIAFNYWETFKWEKDLSQAMGGNHPRVLRAMKECADIQKSWHEIRGKIDKLKLA